MTPQEQAFTQARLDIHLAYPGVFEDREIDVLLAEEQVEEKKLIFAAMDNSTITDPASFWSKLIAIVNVVVAICNIVIPISAAIQSVYGLKSL